MSSRIAAFVAVVAVLVLACPGEYRPVGQDSGTPDAGGSVVDPQASYTYSGCEDAGTYGCANDRVFACAMDAIRANYDACGDAGECEGVVVTNCVGYGECPRIAVNRAFVSQYESEAAAEAGRYCTGATCGSSGSCAYVYDRVDCVAGRCRWLPDGGR